PPHRSVVEAPMAPPGFAGAVAADADREVRSIGVPLIEHIPDHVGVLAREGLVLAVRADELELVVVRPLDPVVVNLVPLGAALHVVAAVSVVHVAMLHAEDGAGM